MEAQGPHIRVVGATIEHDGLLRDVVAIAPPEASALAPHPEAFEEHGDVAIMDVEQGRAPKESGELATDIMLEDASRTGNVSSRVVGSKALPGVVSMPTLRHETTQNLR